MWSQPFLDGTDGRSRSMSKAAASRDAVLRPALPEPILRIRAACRRSLGVVALFSAAINILMLTGALYMLQVYDRVLTSRSWETLIYLTIIAGAALVVLGTLEMLRGKIVGRITTYIEESVGPEALERIIEASLTGRSYRTEALRDLSMVRQFMGGAGMFALFDTPWVPVYLAVITLMHPVLGAVATAGALLMLGLAMLGNALTRSGLREGSKLQLKNMQRIEAFNRNAEVIDAMGMFPALCRRWLATTREASDFTERASDRVGTVAAIIKTLRQLLQIMVLGVGAWLVLQQEATGGIMIAGSILMGRALAPVEQVVGAWKLLVGAREAYGRLIMFFSVPSTRNESMQLPAPTGRLAAEQVTYLPPGAETAALQNVSFAITPGETLAIVGPSAAGKSTLARMIVGVLSPRMGRVRLDGADVHAWNREQFGRFVGYLPQDIELFEGTVGENIARFEGEYPAEIVAAAQLAGCHEMILRLPDGYDTQIGEGGARLSAGQRQRIGLARALFGEPRLVVLDEPNSNLDAEGEVALADALKALAAAGTTVVVVTHRPNLLAMVKKMLVLRDGTVAMFGPRDQVMAQLRPQQPTTVTEVAGKAAATESVVRPLKRAASVAPAPAAEKMP